MKRQLPTISTETEAQSLFFSLLALAWALKFHSALGDLESDLHDGLHSIASYLEMRRSTSRKPQSIIPLSWDTSETTPEPRILVQSAEILVILKPPGWEVDTSANECEALCLSTFLQDHFVEED